MWNGLKPLSHLLSDFIGFSDTLLPVVLFLIPLENLAKVEDISVERKTLRITKLMPNKHTGLTRMITLPGHSHRLCRGQSLLLEKQQP